MGNGGSVCNSVGLKRQLAILVVGLDNSGKTCTSRALVGETLSDAVPTIGFSKFITKYKGIVINIYDLGGSSKIREIWHNYFAEAHGVVYVVDASDLQRLSEVHHNLSSLMKNPTLKGKPLLLLANKQDHLDALDEIDIADKLQLEMLANQCQTPTRIEICCATQGTGKNIDPIIRIGFHWLIESILRSYDKIQRRVVEDVAAQKTKEEKEREARRERIERLKALQNEVEEIVTDVVVEHTNNITQSFQELAEEWNLPGSIISGMNPSQHLESFVDSNLMTEDQINQIEEVINSEMVTSTGPSLDLHGSTPAPGESPVERPTNIKTSTLSRNDQINSPSPVNKKPPPARSNGKALPPLKKNVQFPR